MDPTRAKELEPYNLLWEEETKGLELSPVHVRKPIVDYSIPTKSEMIEILDLIDSAIAERRQVVIDCWDGVGRTGTVVGCIFGETRPFGGGRTADVARTLENSQSRKTVVSPQHTVVTGATSDDTRLVRTLGGKE